MENYVVGMTNKKENEFYFDIDDFDKVAEYDWTVDYRGNVVHRNKDGTRIYMHKLIMGDGNYIHKNGLKYDNRKNNIAPTRGYKNDSKTYLNGYIAIYMPEHPKSFENGCVYEHVLIAEKKLNRPLKENECVHHIDLDRTNNDENNLMVFASSNDHTAFHGGGKPILQSDGTYVCETKFYDYYKYNNRTKKDIVNEIQDMGSIIIVRNREKYNLCPVCKNNIKTLRANMCINCYNAERSNNMPSKDVLEKLIYEKSFSEIGRMYGVSDNAIRKWCKKYSLPNKRSEINQIKTIHKVE